MEIQSLCPNLSTADMAGTLKLYMDLLGFSIIMKVPENAPYAWAMFQKNEASIMFQEKNSLNEEYPILSARAQGGSFTLYIKVTGIRNLFEKLNGKVNIVKELNTTFYGATEFTIEDNNGYILTFAEDE